MRLRCFVAAALWAWAPLILGACTASQVAGELSARECADGDDNDGDDLFDCFDPDCHAFDVCNPETRRPRSQIGSAVMGEVPGVDASTMLSDPLAPPSDEPSMPEEPTPADEVPAEPGPGSEPASPMSVACDPACVAPDVCVEGICLVPVAVFADSWQITEVEVTVPRRLEPSSPCLDEGAIWCPGGSPSVDFWGCACPPDPEVQVWVANPPEAAELVGTTQVIEKADEGTWMLATPIELLLLASSEIVLKVLDRDGDGGEPIFECGIAADPDVLGAGVLICTQSFQTDRGTSKEYAIQAHVTPVPE